MPGRMRPSGGRCGQRAVVAPRRRLPARPRARLRRDRAAAGPSRPAPPPRPLQQRAVGPLVSAEPAGDDEAAQRDGLRRQAGSTSAGSDLAAAETSSATPSPGCGAAVRRSRPSCRPRACRRLPAFAPRPPGSAPNSARRLRGKPAQGEHRPRLGGPPPTSSVSKTPFSALGLESCRHAGGYFDEMPATRQARISPIPTDLRAAGQAVSMRRTTPSGPSSISTVPARNAFWLDSSCPAERARFSFIGDSERAARRGRLL